MMLNNIFLYCFLAVSVSSDICSGAVANIQRKSLSSTINSASEHLLLDKKRSVSKTIKQIRKILLKHENKQLQPNNDNQNYTIEDNKGESNNNRSSGSNNKIIDNAVENLIDNNEDTKFRLSELVDILSNTSSGDGDDVDQKETHTNNRNSKSGGSSSGTSTRTTKLSSTEFSEFLKNSRYDSGIIKEETYFDVLQDQYSFDEEFEDFINDDESVEEISPPKGTTEPSCDKDGSSNKSCDTAPSNTISTTILDAKDYKDTNTDDCSSTYSEGSSYVTTNVCVQTKFFYMQKKCNKMGSSGTAKTSMTPFDKLISDGVLDDSGVWDPILNSYTMEYMDFDEKDVFPYMWTAQINEEDELSHMWEEFIENTEEFNEKLRLPAAASKLLKGHVGDSSYSSGGDLINRSSSGGAANSNSGDIKSKSRNDDGSDNISLSDKIATLAPSSQKNYYNVTDIIENRHTTYNRQVYGNRNAVFILFSNLWNIAHFTKDIVWLYELINAKSIWKSLALKNLRREVVGKLKYVLKKVNEQIIVGELGKSQNNNADSDGANSNTNSEEINETAESSVDILSGGEIELTNKISSKEDEERINKIHKFLEDFLQNTSIAISDVFPQIYIVSAKFIDRFDNTALFLHNRILMRAVLENIPKVFKPDLDKLTYFSTEANAGTGINPADPKYHSKYGDAVKDAAQEELVRKWQIVKSIFQAQETILKNEDEQASRSLNIMSGERAGVRSGIKAVRFLRSALMWEKRCIPYVFQRKNERLSPKYSQLFREKVWNRCKATTEEKKYGRVKVSENATIIEVEDKLVQTTTSQSTKTFLKINHSSDSIDADNNSGNKVSTVVETDNPEVALEKSDENATEVNAISDMAQEISAKNTTTSHFSNLDFMSRVPSEFREEVREVLDGLDKFESMGALAEVVTETDTLSINLSEVKDVTTSSSKTELLKTLFVHAAKDKLNLVKDRVSGRNPFSSSSTNESQSAEGKTIDHNSNSVEVNEESSNRNLEAKIDDELRELMVYLGSDYEGDDSASPSSSSPVEHSDVDAVGNSPNLISSSNKSKKDPSHHDHRTTSTSTTSLSSTTSSSSSSSSSVSAVIRDILTTPQSVKDSEYFSSKYSSGINRLANEKDPGMRKLVRNLVHGKPMKYVGWKSQHFVLLRHDYKKRQILNERTLLDYFVLLGRNLNIKFAYLAKQLEWRENVRRLRQLRDLLKIEIDKIFDNSSSSGIQNIINVFVNINLRLKHLKFNVMRIPSVDFVIMGTVAPCEQIQKWRDALLVIGIHGADISNLVWMQPGSHILEIIEKHDDVCRYVPKVMWQEAKPGIKDELALGWYMTNNGAHDIDGGPIFQKARSIYLDKFNLTNVPPLLPWNEEVTKLHEDNKKECPLGRIGEAESRGYYETWAESLGIGYDKVKLEGHYSKDERNSSVVVNIKDIRFAVDKFLDSKGLS